MDSATTVQVFPRMSWPGQFSINEEHFQHPNYKQIQMTEEEKSKLVKTVSVISVLGSWSLFEI
jgi:hypothetical protein